MENKPAGLLVPLGKALNVMAPSWCGRQMVFPALCLPHHLGAVDRVPESPLGANHILQMNVISI